ncbi:hypothetical protein [Kribbella italica]|uniref:Uncharacterized protein n=1 Tax=Kribbella italica TaxID=1540520 RepID=A0A7W9MRC7_9ACTN|nr:hypothetical protein [Kribbella italica]MBB5833399.1 hypothetical protein [Kribbella italica]
MTAVFAEPSTNAKLQQNRAAGGDNEVPREEGSGRPKIRNVCHNPQCDGVGRIPSEKRPGNTIQCPKCKGKGEITRAYSRVTSYIDVLEDKSQLMAWGERSVLIGVVLDPSLTEGVAERDPENADDKDWLNRRAKVAKQTAGSEKKAERGTYLHGLSELKDQGEVLPDDVSFEDVVDMDAYRRTYRHFVHVEMERLVVVDELKVAGTPDRVSKWSCYRNRITGEHVSMAYLEEEFDLSNDQWRKDWEFVELVTPDGQIIDEDDLLITDLKTGRVDFGQLKIAMQLSIYSRGEFYSHTPASVRHCRRPMGEVRKDWGIIINLPAGSGEAELYWADLDMGWEGVQVAGKVRDLRNRGKKALIPFSKNALRTELVRSA